MIMKRKNKLKYDSDELQYFSMRSLHLNSDFNFQKINGWVALRAQRSSLKMGDLV